MKIESISARELRMRLKAPFETSFGTTWHRRVLLVEVRSAGLSGWGEITAPESPFYNGETTDTAWSVLADFIVPMVLGKSIESPGETASLTSAIRGHEMARAGVENAVWDLQARIERTPLHRLLGGVRDEIACGVSLGIQERPEALLANIERELAAGYQRIKIKIKPGKDLDVLEGIRRVQPHVPLMADANSAYTLADAGLFERMEPFDLMMIEQPLQWDDLVDHAALQSRLRTPVCLDESIHNAHQAAAAIALRACRVINIKLGRVGGHREARSVHDVCARHQIPVWCGGMLESGIGRAHNIAMSTLPGFSLPGDISASHRYWEEDIIDPAVEVSPRGTIRVPESPGLGYTVRIDRIEALTVRHEEWTDGASLAVPGPTAS